MKKVLLNKLLIAFGAVIYCITVSNVWGLALNIKDHRTDKSMHCVELDEKTFALSFVHSVSLTPVYDHYLLLSDNNTYQILQTEERFSAHGQGLPSLQNEPNALAFEHKNGQFILKLERLIHQLIVRTDRRFKNRLYANQITINLNQWPDRALQIQPIKRCDEVRKRNYE